MLRFAASSTITYSLSPCWLVYMRRLCISFTIQRKEFQTRPTGAKTSLLVGVKNKRTFANKTWLFFVCWCVWWEKSNQEERLKKMSATVLVVLREWEGHFHVTLVHRTKVQHSCLAYLEPERCAIVKMFTNVCGTRWPYVKGQGTIHFVVVSSSQDITWGTLLKRIAELSTDHHLVVSRNKWPRLLLFAGTKNSWTQLPDQRILPFHTGGGTQRKPYFMSLWGSR